MATITVAMIVRNEAHILEQTLTKLTGYYDELILVDTGSTDTTKEIAKKFTDNIYDFPWIDDFAAARNCAFDKATQDWIMCIDADDVIEQGKQEQFRAYLDSLDKDKVHIIKLPVYCSETTAFDQIRVVQKGKGRWIGKIHEIVDHDYSKEITSDVVCIKHEKPKESLVRDPNRNLRIIEGFMKDVPRYTFYNGRELKAQGRYKEAIVVFKRYLDIAVWWWEKHYACIDLANCYYCLGDIENSRKYDLEAIGINDRIIDPYIQLAKLAYDKQDWKGVILWCEAGLAIRDRQPALFDYIPNHTYIPQDYLTVAYWNVGEYEKGIISSKKCVEFCPNDVRMINNLKFYEDRLKVH